MPGAIAKAVGAFMIGVSLVAALITYIAYTLAGLLGWIPAFVAMEIMGLVAGAYLLLAPGRGMALAGRPIWIAILVGTFLLGFVVILVTGMTGIPASWTTFMVGLLVLILGYELYRIVRGRKRRLVR